MRDFFSQLLRFSGLGLLLLVDLSYGFPSSSSSSLMAPSIKIKGAGCRRIQAQAVASTSTKLYAKGDNNNNNTTSTATENSLIGTVSPAILIGDILSIAVALQFLGLVDVLDDPIFWKNGGWLQPIDVASSESTLPILVQTFAIASGAWIFPTALLKGFTNDAVETPTVALQSALKLLIPFSLMLVLLEAVESTFFLGAANQMDALEVAQIGYFAATFILAGRYLISRIPIF